MRRCLLSFLLALTSAVARGEGPRFPLEFTFGTGDPEFKTRGVPAGKSYTPGGFGFDLDSKVVQSADATTSDRPFFFSVALPEGNYRVTATLGDWNQPSETTIKAESRRLMIDGVKTQREQHVAVSFVVNVRTPRLASGGSVRINGREKDSFRWDDRLTLEFNGPRPRLHALEIMPAENVVTVFLVGDSTVCDQAFEPWNSWGQMLPRFFGPGAAVANHAESGKSLRSAAAERRLDKVYESLKPGDYLFVQFGHNDMKERGAGVGAFTTFAADLRRVVQETRKRKAHPVLVTPMHRKTFEASGHVLNSHGDYPEAVRRVAREERATLVDLHAMSKTLYEALGPAKVGSAFVDGSHHNNYGSFELARCVVESIRHDLPDLALRLRDDAVPFNPARPDPPESFHVPASPQRDPAKPEGN